jgi:hypothetical protein
MYGNMNVKQSKKVFIANDCMVWGEYREVGWREKA